MELNDFKFDEFGILGLNIPSKHLVEAISTKPQTFKRSSDANRYSYAGKIFRNFFNGLIFNEPTFVENQNSNFSSKALRI